MHAKVRDDHEALCGWRRNCRHSFEAAAGDRVLLSQLARTVWIAACHPASLDDTYTEGEGS